MTINASSYNIAVRHADIDGEMLYEARVREFPHLIFYSDEMADAYESAIAGVNDVIADMQTHGKTAPEPIDPDKDEEYSGRITLRIPRSLHRALAENAMREHVSLNQCLVSMLSYRISDPFIMTSSRIKFSETSFVVPEVSVKSHRNLTLVHSNQSGYARAG